MRDVKFRIKRLPIGLPPDWLLVLALGVGLVVILKLSFPLNTGDVFHLQYAAYQWHVGSPEKIYATYDSSSWNRWLKDWYPVAQKLGADSLPYLHTYPPILSAALSPIADVPARRWMVVQAAVNFSMLFLLSVATVRLCGLSLTLRPFLWALALSFGCSGFADCISIGQISAVLAAILWAGLLALRDNRWVRGSILIAIASVVKLTPMGFLIYPAIRGKWKPLIVGFAMLIGIAALSVIWLGFDIHRTWWLTARSIADNVWPQALDQSISATYARLISGVSVHAANFVSTPDITILRAAAMIIFGGSSLGLLYITRRTSRPDAFPAGIGLLLCAILLSLPFTWNHYLMVLLPVIGWALLVTWQDPSRRISRLWVWISAFLICAPTSKFAGDTFLRLLVTSSHTIGIIMLWIWLGWRLLNLPENRIQQSPRMDLEHASNWLSR